VNDEGSCGQFIYSAAVASHTWETEMEAIITTPEQSVDFKYHLGKHSAHVIYKVSLYVSRQVMTSVLG
jgi:hypothetical protein